MRYSSEATIERQIGITLIALDCRELWHRILGVGLRDVGCWARNVGCLARRVGCLTQYVGFWHRVLGVLYSKLDVWFRCWRNPHLRIPASRRRARSTRHDTSPWMRFRGAQGTSKTQDDCILAFPISHAQNRLLFSKPRPGGCMFTHPPPFA